jgi:type 1 fimbriae regulatory protein FimB/type 1 fimbriae regulatory protein FimE
MTPVALTQTELRSLLTTCHHHDYRAYVMFILTTLHGLRVSEAIALRRRDFTVNDGTIFLTVQRLKGSEKTTQRLNSCPESLFNEAKVVGDFIRNMQPDTLLFRDKDDGMLTRWQVATLMQTYGRMASVPDHKCHVHSLKHTAGLLMRQAGCKLEEIQSALGHKSLNSTAQYLRVSADEADDARAQAFGAAAGGR